MNRREFLNWFSLFGISTSLPFAIAACSKSIKADQAATVKEVGSVAPSVAPTIGYSPRPDGFTPVGSLSALKAANSGVISPNEVAVVVVKNASDPNKPIAVNPRCTHKACTVEWHKGVNEFVCPCHDAHFSASGEVKSGPPDKALQAYDVKVEGDTILVKIA
jgi:cytochrome b6-f complex iron-sulfur subunit